MPFDALVVEQIKRAGAIAQRRNATDVTFGDLFEAVLGRRLSPALTALLAEAVTIAEERGDDTLSEAHLLLAELADESVLRRWVETLGVEIDSLTENVESWLETKGILGGPAAAVRNQGPPTQN